MIKINEALRGKFGFSFIELLLVILIIGALSTFAIPQLKKTISSSELDNFVKDIYYLSRYLQESAVSQGKIYYLNINCPEASFQASYKLGNNFKKVEGRFGKIYKAPSGITISIGLGASLDQKGIYFYPDASIDEIIINFVNKQESKVSLVIKGAAGAIKIK